MPQVKIKVTGQLAINGKARPFTNLVWVRSGNNAMRDARYFTEAKYSKLKAVTSVQTFKREYV